MIKNTQILVLFLLGSMLTILGVYLKFDGWSFYSLIVIIGMTFNAFAFILLIFKMFKGNKNKSFLDS